VGEPAKDHGKALLGWFQTTISGPADFTVSVMAAIYGRISVRLLSFWWSGNAQECRPPKLPVAFSQTGGCAYRLKGRKQL